MISNFTKGLVEKVCGENTLKVGAQVSHKDGRLVEITDGQYWGTRGISNFWYWREVKEDGTLAEKIECGYGKDLRS